jgi:hypothetical protein
MTERLCFNERSKFVSLGGGFTTHTDNERPKKWPDVWIVPEESIVSEKIPLNCPQKSKMS